MRTIIKIGTISFLFLVIISCNQAKRETDKRISQFVGDTLFLPEKSEVLYKDSLYQKDISINNNAKLKISTLLWGDCHSCIADLKK